MDDRQACWGILPKVSRSFSLCIKVLPAPLDSQMMLSYLLYRAIDTIEDSHASVEDKKILFDMLIGSLRCKKYPQERVARLKTALAAKLDYTYEKELVGNIDAVIREYYEVPAKARSAIRGWGRVMARGMYEFQTRKIRTFKDQDLYSYYVAGVVGHLFNDLLLYNDVITEKMRDRLHLHARKFGLALQKVNILRDVAHDIPSGRRYWPLSTMQKYQLGYSSLLKSENRGKAMKVLREEIDDAVQYLHSAMYYTMSLPKTALRVRMFCLIPLFMAIESYVKCIDNHEIFESEKTVKITREQVHAIVAKSTLLGMSNSALAKWFMQAMAKASPALARQKYVEGTAGPENARK